MRQSGPFLAVALASLLWMRAGLPAHAQEPGPFPSPSPSTAPPGGNGYVAIGFGGANSSGGLVPPAAGSTSTPAPFASANARGFSLDLLGRLSDRYLARLTFDNYAIHGNDNPFVSYSQGVVLYNPHTSSFAFGVGYLSVQRSTSSVSLNGGGFGASLLPRFRSGTSVYASVFFFPRLSAGGTSASITSLDAGVIIAPPRRGGFFYRAGGFAKNGGGARFSPTQVSGLSVGVGASF